MYFSKEQITNTVERLIAKMRHDHSIYNCNKADLLAIVTKELGEEKLTVMHEKDSHKKYGDATEYGFESWMDYCEQCSIYRKSLIAVKICPCCGGPMTEIDGAHVIDLLSKEVFITPTCHTCNANAATDETFRRNHQFEVCAKNLVPFDHDELKKLRR